MSTYRVLTFPDGNKKYIKITPKFNQHLIGRPCLIHAPSDHCSQCNEKHIPGHCELYRLNDIVEYTRDQYLALATLKERKDIPDPAVEAATKILNS